MSRAVKYYRAGPRPGEAAFTFNSFRYCDFGHIVSGFFFDFFLIYEAYASNGWTPTDEMTPDLICNATLKNCRRRQKKLSVCLSVRLFIHFANSQGSRFGSMALAVREAVTAAIPLKKNKQVETFPSAVTTRVTMKM